MAFHLSRRLFIASLVLTSFGLSSLATAQKPTEAPNTKAEKAVSDFIEKVLDLSKQPQSPERAKAQLQMVRNYFNIPSAGKNTFGPLWDRASKGQQEQFSRTYALWVSETVFMGSIQEDIQEAKEALRSSTAQGVLGLTEIDAASIINSPVDYEVDIVETNANSKGEPIYTVRVMLFPELMKNEKLPNDSRADGIVFANVMFYKGHPIIVDCFRSDGRDLTPGDASSRQYLSWRLNAYTASDGEFRSVLRRSSRFEALQNSPELITEFSRYLMEEFSKRFWKGSLTLSEIQK